MNICIIGDGLTGLSLAKNLINKKINVHIYCENRTTKISPNRTIGISRSNIDFFRNEIQDIPKNIFWKINKIKINSEKLEGQNILKFENNKEVLFYMIKNYKLYDLLREKVLKNKSIKKIKNKIFYEKLIKEKKYDLIINCIKDNYLSKKYFTKKIEKNYYNQAFTTILKHKKIKNNTAVQNFTKFGPIAFLPISNTETSVVCSLDTKKKLYVNSDVVKLINQNNPKYEIKKVSTFDNFNLGLTNLRSYRHKNILAFGDLLHRIHPLAGQGFNMNLRDIKVLSEIIQSKIDVGIQLDSSILDQFEINTKNKNFIFSNSIDFIYEVFNIDNKTKNNTFNNILRIIGKNKNLNNYFIKIADKGLNF
jgi:2-octaprenyl-6-methoxyphenol hydroxylase